MSERRPSQPAVLDIDTLEATARAASAIAPGKWHWHGDTHFRSGVELATWIQGAGRCSVMRPIRYGMRAGQPSFGGDDFMMHPAHDLVRYEVGRQDLIGDAARQDPGLYRQDIRGIAHPIAEHIAAASPDIVLALIARIRELEADMPETAITAAIETIARAILGAIDIETIAEWEDWPDIGEYDWAEVIRAIERLLPEHPSTEARDAAYALLGERADHA